MPCSTFSVARIGSNGIDAPGPARDRNHPKGLNHLTLLRGDRPGWNNSTQTENKSFSQVKSRCLGQATPVDKVSPALESASFEEIPRRARRSVA